MNPNLYECFFFFLSELDCVLVSFSDVTAHCNRSRLTVLLDVPHRKKTKKQYTTPLSSATLWSWINAALPRAIFSLFLSRGHMCSNASSRPLIGSGWPKPPPVLVAPRQRISLPGAHVRRQMESESVSGLSEMSFTSAAHKESGHSWSGITRWKGGVSESLSSTLTSLTPR